MERLGVTHKYYQRVESGRANVTLATLEKIASAFEMKAEDLFLLPLDSSREADELLASICGLMKRRDRKALKKLSLFVKETL
ncbi:MAG: helix-turn-helix transcriptional regulator [Thermodesulfobacteriota bacterium]